MSGGWSAEAGEGEGRGARGAGFDPRMLESLVCPRTGHRLEWNAEAGELVSRAAGLAFPVRGGIPIMLIDEARVLEG